MERRQGCAMKRLAWQSGPAFKSFKVHNYSKPIEICIIICPLSKIHRNQTLLENIILVYMFCSLLVNLFYETALFNRLIPVYEAPYSYELNIIVLVMLCNKQMS